MPVRKTESRLPTNFQATDLGEAFVAPDSRWVIVSFINNPLVLQRANTYIVFVTDAALVTSVQDFEWNFAVEGQAVNLQTTSFGEIIYMPTTIGKLTLTVRLLDAVNSELAAMSVTQQIVDPNTELEGLILASQNETGPSVGDVEVVRELINDHNSYYQAVSLQTPEAGEGFRQFVFSMVYDGVLQRNAQRRQQQLTHLANCLNGQGGDFTTIISEGLGVAGVRIALLAMILPKNGGNTAPYIGFAEVPEANPLKTVRFQALCQQVADLDEASRIDLFNLVRFPKSCITVSGRIIEALRNKYFSGANFNDVLTGLSGTRAHWISRHYNEGPLQHT